MLVTVTTSKHRRIHWAAASLTAALVGAGCIGSIGGDDEAGNANVPAGPTTQCALDMDARPGLRLSEKQYNNSVRDLLGLISFDAELEEEPGSITKLAVRQLGDAAELATSLRAEWTETVFPCDTSGAEDLACVDAFIDGFGPKVYRRPLSDAERQILRQAYDDARAELSFDAAMEVVLEVMLQAPAFVYMFEDGVPTATGDVRLLSDHEVATRLSYFLWNSTPDDELLAAADAGELSSPDALSAHVDRLLENPRARAAVADFMAELLQLNGGQLHFPLEQATKEPALYPEVDDALLAAMRTETNALIEKVMFDGSGQFDELWTSRDAYVNGPLATLYGVEGGPTDTDTWEWVTLPDHRAGLLTRAAFLTTFATATVTAPIRRGHWVREEMLCDDLADPPPNVDDTPLEGGANQDGEVLTVREATEVRTMTDSQCAGCHSLINPLGYPFEGFDAIGRTQLTEVVSGEPVDTVVDVTNTDFDGTIDDAVHISSELAESGKVRSCFAERWLTRALGGEAPASCEDGGPAAAFAESGDMKALLVGIITSDAFRYVNVGQN